MTDSNDLDLSDEAAAMEDMDEPGESIEDFDCTCSGRDTPGDHKQSCDLLTCWEYRQGFADWDPDNQCLVMVDQEGADFWKNATSGEDDDLPPLGSTSTSTTSYGGWGSYGKGTTTYPQKCRHYQEAVILAGGVKVYASSHHSDRYREKTMVPDLGIYLDGCWKPDTIAYHIGCPDYSTPIPALSKVLQIARQALAMAREGQMVEIGCIGGHGRTGLMLSILALVAAKDAGTKLTGDDAVHFIRKIYCDHAVESSSQEWYLRCVAAQLHGDPHPLLPIESVKVRVPDYWFPKPKPIVTTTTPKPNAGAGLVEAWRSLGNGVKY